MILNINNNPWLNVLHFKELVDYLSISDIKHLTMSCKHLRIKLTPNFFNTFKFDCFIDEGDYKSCIFTQFDDIFNDYDELVKYTEAEASQNEFAGEIDTLFVINPCRFDTKDYRASKNKFIDDLKLYPCNPKKLIIDIHDCYYLLYDLHIVFNNIKSLTIESSIISFGTLQQLMGNLILLEDLTLSSNWILKYKEDFSKFTINWPESLKKLKILKNYFADVDDKELSVILSRNIDSYLDFSSLQLANKHLPNLVILDYSPPGNVDDFEELSRFLSANQQIKELKTRFVEANQELFNTVASLTNLKSYYISNYHYGDNMDETVSTLNSNSVERLYMSLNESHSILNLIASYFPNVTDLTFSPCLMELSELLCIASLFNKLKALTLKTHLEFTKPTKISFPKLENLESVEFIGANLLNFEEIKWDINNCPNLKLVSFTRPSNLHKAFEIPEQCDMLTNGWKLVSFSRKLSFYRIENN
jgi:uncharacterized protein YozE (UPF0346 family)